MDIVAVHHLPSRVIHIQEVEYLFFSGTNYLGIGCHEQFRSTLIQEMAKYGTIYSSSRNSNLQLSIYKETEAFFANKYGFEDAIITTSGLLAGQMALSALKNQKIVYAPSVHPAIRSQDKQTLHKKFDCSYQEFAKGITDVVEDVDFPVVIATNTIDNIRCENYDFNWIKHLPNSQEITLLFDYSHGIGLLDLDENILSAKKHKEVLVIASLAKAMGLPGGLILAGRKIITRIRNNPMFVGASPMIPAYLSAFLSSHQLYEDCLHQLQENIKYFNYLNKYPFQSISNFPVYYTSDNMYKQLFEKNIFVSNFSYPNPLDKPLSRIVLNAAHTERDIEKLTQELNRINH